MYERQGEYQKATTYYQKAFNIFLVRLGADHPNIQIVYKNMKVVYSEWNPKGNFEQWLEEQRREIRKSPFSCH